MSLVFSAIVPHPPLLLPSIGREHAKLLGKTWIAYQQVSASLAASGAESIVVITPHFAFVPGTFLLNYSPTYKTNFKEFGDFSKPREYEPDHLLIEKIQRNSRKEKHPLILLSEEHMDYGGGVPLYFLPHHNLKTKIVIIAPSDADIKSQFAFGKIIKDAILQSRHKIAVICSADLSHRHSSDSPSGFSKQAKIFDEMMVANLSAGNASPILQMDDALVSEAHACGYKPICLFLGIMDKISCSPELLSYEVPFGVGYATLEFRLN
jgi:AmmeMemoRadiSam system protein B